MARRLALVLCVSILAAGCAAEPTAPVARARARLTPGAVSADSLTDGTNPDGSCRSGFSLTNGRCI